jgi:hypothetical protein
MSCGLCYHFDNLYGIFSDELSLGTGAALIAIIGHFLSQVSGASG